MPKPETQTTMQTVAQELAAAFESDKRIPYELQAMQSALNVLHPNDIATNNTITFLQNAIRVAEEKRATFYKIREGAPKWIWDYENVEDKLMFRVHKAIDDRLPDDWIYEQAAHVADRFTHYDFKTADDLRDLAFEIADSLVDVYNTDRLRWLASNLDNVTLVDEAIIGYEIDFHGDNATGILGAIGAGQILAIERIALALIDAIEAEAEKRPAQ